MKAKGKKGSTEDKGPHPYDFTLKKQTKHDRSDAKPLKPDLMAAAMTKSHGLEKAKRIVEPLTVSSFKDNTGTPVAVNESSSYWKAVFQALNRGSKNAIAS